MFRSLALSSGGMRGGILVGALSALQEIRGSLVFPDGVYGCSIGSVIATAVAFGLSADAIRQMFDEDFQMSAALPELRLSHIQEMNARKGVFSMDKFEEVIASAFAKHGVDLRDKKVGDAQQKLFIQATNLTTCRNVWLTGDVPVLAAIRASSCIPFLFQPQVIYNNVYVDGAIKEPCIHKLVPEDCLVLHIERSPMPVFPADLETMPLSEWLTRVFTISRARHLPSNVIAFSNNTIHVLQELTPADRQELLRCGNSCVQRFFAERVA